MFDDSIITNIIQAGTVVSIAALAYAIAWFAKKNGWVKDTRIPLFVLAIGIFCGILAVIFVPGTRVDFGQPWQDVGYAIIIKFVAAFIQATAAALAAVGINQIGVQAAKEKNVTPDETSSTDTSIPG